MHTRTLFRAGALIAGVVPLFGLLSCSSSGTPSVPVTAASVLTQASVAGVSGATFSSSSSTMATGAGAAPVVSSTSVASPGAAVTLSVQTASPASQILIGVQGLPGFTTINLGAARSRSTGPQTYLVTITLGMGSLPNPLILTVETADQAGNLSMAATISLIVVQPGSGNPFAGQYTGNFSGTISNNGVNSTISGPITAVIDSSGALTATGTPTQPGQNPATFTGGVSQSGLVSATSPQGNGQTLTLSGSLQLQGSAATGTGNITGSGVNQVTWSITRVSTTVPPSFAGQYSGSFSGTQTTNGVSIAVTGPIAMVVDGSGALTATFSPTQAGEKPGIFTGTVSQSGVVSATALNGGGGVLTLAGNLQAQGSSVSGSGSVSGSFTSGGAAVTTVQGTWTVSRFSTAVAASLFAGNYVGTFSGDNTNSGTLSATVDSSGNFTATGTPSGGGGSSTSFTGTVSATGNLSASGTPTGSTNPITLTGAFERVGTTVTANGTFHQTNGGSGSFSLQPAVR